MLSKREREYLSGDLKVSKQYRRVLEYRIREKLNQFITKDLTLLQKTNVTEFRNSITGFSNSKALNTTVERTNSIIKSSLERDSISRPNAYEAFALPG